MSNYTLTFYVNDVDGCVSCLPDEKPIGKNWLNGDEDYVLNEIAHCGIERMYFKVSPEVFDAVLESHNIN